MKTLLAILALALQDAPAAPADLGPETFGALHRFIRPRPGESRWREVPWHLSAWDARRQAAAEGKPILVWSGGGCPPLGSC